MSLENKINQILSNPQSDWQNSFFNKNMIITEYLKLKCLRSSEFKEKSVTWLTQAITNNQENLICFLSSFTPLDESLLGLSYAYNHQNIFAYLTQQHSNQNSVSSYKINFNSMYNEKKLNYYLILYCIENNQFDLADKWISEDLIRHESNITISLLLEKAVNKPNFFNALVKAMQKNEGEAKFAVEYFNPNIFVEKIIENDSLKENKYRFFCNFFKYLKEEVKDKLLDYLLTEEVDYAVLIDFNGDLILHNQARLEKVMDHYQFKDDDYRHTLERFMSELDFNFVASTFIYSKIKAHDPMKEKTILLDAIYHNKEELIDEILYKNNFNFQDSQYEILKALAKQDSPYFDKIMELLLTEKEVKTLDKILEVKNESNNKKMKL